MRQVVVVSVALLAGTGVLSSQAPPPRVAPSTFASVEVHIAARSIGGKWYQEDAGLAGPARIAISYGQPHARGRRVEGGLIPLDTVWRFGANQATELHTDVDLTIGDLQVPRGDYSLFVLHGTNGWQLIVNRKTAVWGTEYDRAADVGRVALTSRVLAEPEESLSIYLIPDVAKPGTGAADLAGALRIKWGGVELGTRWRAGS